MAIWRPGDTNYILYWFFYSPITYVHFYWCFYSSSTYVRILYLCILLSLSCQSPQFLVAWQSLLSVYHMPRSGPGQFLTLTGYSSLFPNIIWRQAIYVQLKISLTTISRPSIVLRLSVVFGLGNSNLFSTLILYDQKWKFMDLFFWSENFMF